MIGNLREVRVATCAKNINLRIKILLNQVLIVGCYLLKQGLTYIYEY